MSKLSVSDICFMFDNLQVPTSGLGRYAGGRYAQAGDEAVTARRLCGLEDLIRVEGCGGSFVLGHPGLPMTLTTRHITRQTACR